MSEKSSSITPFAKTTKSFWDYFKLRRTLPNPGKFEEIQKEPRSIFLANEIFDGAKFEINKAVGQSEKHGFSTIHSFTLGAKEEGPAYNFGTTYATDQIFLNSRMGTDQKLTSRYHHQFTPNLGLKFMAQVSPSDQEPAGWTSDIDYKGGDYYASAKVGLPLVLGLSYMQSITPKLSFGFEGLYQNNYSYSTVFFGARYEGKDFIAAATTTNDLDLDLTYTKNVNEKVALCTELIYSNMKKGTSAAVGFDYKLAQANYRGTIESNGRVLAMLEEKLNPNIRFILCAELNHVKNDYNFGVGLTIQ